MSPSINLSEVVWQEHIVDSASIARESAKLLHDYIQRLQYQHAPPVLIGEIIEVRNKFAEACDRLEAIFNYFPKEP